LVALTESAPEKREGQRRLAREVTAMIHGETELARAEKASQALFGADLSELDATDIADIFADVPSSQVAKSALEGEGLPLTDALTNGGIAPSKGDAKRLIQ